MCCVGSSAEARLVSLHPPAHIATRLQVAHSSCCLPNQKHPKTPGLQVRRGKETSETLRRKCGKFVGLLGVPVSEAIFLRHRAKLALLLQEQCLYVNMSVNRTSSKNEQS